MSDRAFARLLAAATVAAAVVRAALPHAFGDYPTDAGPALGAVAHGNLAGFFAHQPAMGPLSLYLRAPFVAVAAALGDGSDGLYRWGNVPCMLAVAAVAIWLASVAHRRGAGRLGIVLIAAICVLNPLVSDALYWGHPEELLAASVGAGALLAACEDRPVAAAVLGGLAVASKQWAALLVLPTILILGRHRLRVLLGAGAVAVAAWLPMVLASFSGFRHALSYVSHPQPVVTAFTWLYPFSPPGIVTIANPFGNVRTLHAHQIGGLATVTRPMIMVLGAGVVLLAWWRAGRRPVAQPLLLATALALVLRCALDPGSAAYYHLPLLMTLVVLDAATGRRVPVAGLAATAVAFIVLDRAAWYLSSRMINGLYIASTVLGCAIIAQRARRAGLRSA